MLARCTNDYEEALWRVLRTQGGWHGMSHPRALKDTTANKFLEVDQATAVRFFQFLFVPDLISQEEFDLCARDSDLSEKLLSAHNEFFKQNPVRSMPALLLDGETYTGEEAIREALGKRLSE